MLWMKRQEALDRPALIPNSLWRNRVFTSICINVFLIWDAFNAFEQIANFFFQNIQSLSPFQAALRFLPTPISGLVTNMLVGFLVPHIKADRIVILTAVIASISHLPMAVVNPNRTYWALAFPAMFLDPMGAVGLFTVSTLLISSVFRPRCKVWLEGIQHNLADWYSTNAKVSTRFFFTPHPTFYPPPYILLLHS
jgi:Na+/melibiose symporter-like transporter